MKPLPIQSLPAERMAELTRQGARELRTNRFSNRTLPGWTSDDDPPALEHSDATQGRGGCAFVGCLALALVIYGILFALW